MASDSDTGATDSRAILKAVAWDWCDYAMKQMTNAFTPSVVKTAVINGAYAESQAVKDAIALGGTVTFYTLSSGVRVAVFRCAVGLLMSTAAINGTVAKLVQIEAVADEVGIARVTIPALTAEAGAIDSVKLAQEIGEGSAVVAGDSALATVVSDAAAKFAVTATILSTIYDVIQENLQTTQDVEDEEENEGNQQDCADCATQAHQFAVGKGKETFHKASFATSTGGKKYHGRKKSRRN